jgi:uncharacterized protein (UPF0332 family)
MVSRLLEAAELLIQQGGDSSAFRRRAVSTAYYAVFHALAKHCADELLPIARNSDEYERVYRTLEHGSLKPAFSKGSSKNLEEIGNLVVKLQSERNRADYLPPITNLFSRSETETLIDEARKAITKIESLNKRERQTLATALLFRRQSQ